MKTTTIQPRTRMVSIFPTRSKGYVATRSVPVSLKFVTDLVRSRAPIVIASEYGIETFITLVIARLLGRRALVFQEHVGRAGATLSPLDTVYRRLLARLATAFIANTAAAAEEIMRVLHVDSAKVFQVTTLVPPSRSELCQEPWVVELPRSRPLFLYTGQLIIRKNVEAILQASALLRREGLTFEVWIGGEGPDHERLLEIVDELDLESAVRFIGPIPYGSIGFVYEGCDVFIMPSNAEYRSVAVLEAMRFDKPVIDSALDGNAHDCARHGVNAWIFDPADPSNLADCMRRFIVKPGLAREMGKHSHAIIEKHTPDSAAQGLIAVLRRMRG